MIHSYKFIIMDIHAEKLSLIEQLLKIENKALIEKIKALLDFAEREEKKGKLTPMSIEAYYQKIRDSETAIEQGDIIEQKALRKKVKSWKTK